ncbi:hypothetical protein BDD12DRAFT_855909 [Trichophaea hybrida]|nr:hypothetical protein BDD12DRAFT_855909 [Trichophaea hybrida]
MCYVCCKYQMYLSTSTCLKIRKYEFNNHHRLSISFFSSFFFFVRVYIYEIFGWPSIFILSIAFLHLPTYCSLLV